MKIYNEKIKIQKSKDVFLTFDVVLDQADPEVKSFYVSIENNCNYNEDDYFLLIAFFDDLLEAKAFIADKIIIIYQQYQMK